MVKKYTKEYFTEQGKKGAEKKHSTRYEILNKLAGYTNKETQNKILKWSTKNLEILLKTYEDKK